MSNLLKKHKDGYCDLCLNYHNKKIPAIAIIKYKCDVNIRTLELPPKIIDVELLVCESDREFVIEGLEEYGTNYEELKYYFEEKVLLT